MAEKDYTKHYEELGESAAPETVPNTVSRHAHVPDRSFQRVIWESGKPILDADLNLSQDTRDFAERLLRRWEMPSGWLRGQTHKDWDSEITTQVAPDSVSDDSPGGNLIDEGSIGEPHTLVNSFLFPRREAVVAGWPIVVEYVNTSTAGLNLVGLEGPTIYDGTEATVKRTDFLFLEVWLALVAPSVKSVGAVQVAAIADLADGDLITIAGNPLTARAAGPAGVDEFVIAAGDAEATALAIVTAINAPANSFDGDVSAAVSIDMAIIRAAEPGAAGNAITLSVTCAVPGALIASGATLVNGEDRPNKPATAQDKVYRHGNVQSPEATWLDDELVDPTIDNESSQRVQVQYRIRATGPTEAVDYKTHPDGFSNLIGGSATVFGQGGRDAPVSNESGRSYPFVPADSAASWLNSSAAAYGVSDEGLWVAGDGGDQSSQDLSTLDGFVYAIPLSFVFRHNNVSDPLAALQGFDPVNNANGAPTHDHAQYNGVLATIPADLSDRPDGEFSDVLGPSRFLDLRRHVIPASPDMASELQFQMQSLLDGTLRSWAVDTASKQILGGDSGDVSTFFLVCNEIGRSQAMGGNPPSSGDTDHGVFIRNFDHLSRRFGDQPVVERVLFAFYPGDRPTAGAQGGPVAPGLVNPGKYVVAAESAPGIPVDPDAWYEEDELHLDLDTLNASTLGGLFQGGAGGGNSAVAHPDPTVGNFAPDGMSITDVLGVFHDDGHYDAPPVVDQQMQAGLIEGLGTRHLRVVLDANDSVVNGGDSGNPDYHMVGRDVGAPPVPRLDGSTRRIFLEVEVTYPLGAGTTDTTDHEVEPDENVYDGSGLGPGPIIETDDTQRPNDFEALLEPRFRAGYRETQLEYVANDSISHAVGGNNSGSSIGTINPEQIVSRSRTTLQFPRRVYGASGGPMANQTSVTDDVAAVGKVVDEQATDFGSSSRLVTVGTPLSGGGQTLCSIRYFAQDPIPNYGVLGGGYQVAVYFRSNSPQTAGVKEGNILSTGDGVIPTTLRVEPLLMSPNLWTGQRGVGSLDLAYPYRVPLDQVPVNDGGTNSNREWFFCATVNTSIDDFDADTGLLALHPFIQGDIQDTLTLGGLANGQPPEVDGEFRAYYPYSNENSYRPTVMSQPLSGAVRHKVFAPFLARATENVTGVDGGLLFRKNELLLIVLSRFATLDEDNTVLFANTGNRTCAGVYRTRNLLLLVGDR